MPEPVLRISPLRYWGLGLGVLLIAGGLFAYLRAGASPEVAKVVSSSPLRCKISTPQAEPAPSWSGGNSNVARKEKMAKKAPPPEPQLLAGATLKLSGTPRALVADTVLVSLCVEAPGTVPEPRRQALKSHLLLQLTGVGLQIEPHEKIAPMAPSESCLGTAQWTVRASAPGHYTAVLMPASADQQSGQPAAAAAGNPQWDFDLEQPAELNIQFQQQWTDYVQKLWGGIATVLGTVLVVTQILLNLRRNKAQAA